MASNVQWLAGQAGRRSVIDDSVNLRRLQKEILRYLLTYPEAKDTREGIRDWWLPQTRMEFQSVDLSSALNDLVMRGWITASSLRGTVVYGLQHGRRDEILRWLESC